VRLDELRAALAGGVIAPNTPVWKSGWAAWQPAHEVPELTTSALSAANGVVPNIPPPPLAMIAVQQEYEAKGGGSFRPPAVSVGDEPPPPPKYVPLPVKPTSIVPPAPGSSPSVSPPAVAPAAQQLPSSLPTAIGLPPPPELAAMVAASKEAAAAKAAAAPAAVAPAAAPAPAAGKSADPMIEEVSGSMLLDDESAAALGGAPQAPPRVPTGTTMPPPTNPVLHDGSQPSLGDDDDAGLPPMRRPGLTLIIEDLQAIKAGKPPKNKLLLAVLGVVGLSVLIMLLALVVSAFSSKPSEVKPVASASTASSSSPTTAAATGSPSGTATTAAATASAAPAATPAPKEEPKAPAGATLGDCVVAGDAHIMSPRAFIPSGVEATPIAGGLALGFATTARDAVVLGVDPTSLAITSTLKGRALGGDLRRVTPLVVQNKLTVVPEVDRKDRLGGRRVLATNPAIDVGVIDGELVWAPRGLSSFATLFHLDGEGPVDAIRGVPLGHTKGVAVAFRRGGAVYVGLAKGDSVLTSIGSLQRIEGLGPQVGSPALATSGDAVIVAWADRAGAQDAWQIRWTKVDAAGSAAPPKTFAVPDGGLGGPAMSPSVAGLGGGRFVLSWSEGPVSNHQVRAANVGADGAVSGAPLSVSAPGLNAGQPQIAVGADGRGAIAFLAKGKAGYEVHATPLTCAAK